MDSHGEKHNDLIAAVITPPGEGGIGAIRVAGHNACRFCEQFLKFVAQHTDPWAAFTMRLAHFVEPSSNQHESAVIDEVLAVWMPEGKSYSGDEQVELFCHGGQIVLQKIMRALTTSGEIRHAEPGEFTKRAFLAGRIDLTKAEAVAEMIAAKSEFAYDAARRNLFGAVASEVDSLKQKITHAAAMCEAYIDFPEEDIDPDDYQLMCAELRAVSDSIGKLIESYRGGHIIRDGFTIAICGRPNAGKSSLFNILLKKNRAIVSPQAGTTRDYLTEWITLGGYAVALSDTAGMREGAEHVEAIGQQFAMEVAQKADTILWLVDVSDPNWRESADTDIPSMLRARTFIVGNKIDLMTDTGIANNQTDIMFARISCASGVGIAELESKLIAEIARRAPDQTDGLVITSERHAQKLQIAADALTRASDGLTQKRSPELVSFELRHAIVALDEITGRVYTDDLLGVIFAKFCVGK